MGPGRPQDVVVPPAEAAIFLVVRVREGGEDAVRDLIPDVSGLARTVSFRSPEDGLTCVTGIGAAVWPRLFTVPPPAGLHPFRPIEGPVHTAVATPGDLLFHLRARRLDLCFELASLLMARLRDHADVVDEVHGFRYFDERDLLGFVDGTENPTREAADAAVLVGAEDPAFAGGSYVVVQKYLHDLAAWNALQVEEQERVIGRHKLDNVEIPDNAKAPNSHVALNTIEAPDGSQRQIVRDNLPFGNVGSGESGTYFIGYASSPDVIEEMLQNMFLGRPPGTYDRLLDFSTALTGSLYFVPTVDFLDAGGAPDSSAAEAAPETPCRPGGDHSLGIGSLKGR